MTSIAQILGVQISFEFYLPTSGQPELLQEPRYYAGAIKEWHDQFSSSEFSR